MYYYYYYYFELHPENRIGFKKLSKADLGLNTTGNQTHIGLLSDVCTFLGDEDVKQAILVHENYCDILTCSFDRIMKPDGSFRSAKIRVGDRTDSIVYKIREFAKEKPFVDWYLFWGGLASEELYFWLVSSDSAEYMMLRSLLCKDKDVITLENPYFEKLAEIVSKKINFTSTDLKAELEIASQIGKSQYTFKQVDLEKAKIRYEKIGRSGEELINDYLEREKYLGHIRCFEWANKKSESGLPYDFIIDKKSYVDVKSTDISFNHLIFFSDNEIKFAANNHRDYSVFRVFDMKEQAKKLRVCNDCSTYMRTMEKNLLSFEEQSQLLNTTLSSIRLGVKPENCFNKIQPIINL